MSRVSEDAPADRGLRHGRRAQRAARRRARGRRALRPLRRLAAADPERPLRRRRRHLGPARRRPLAAAGRARADGVARAGLRRGQRRPAEAAVVRAPGRDAGGRAAARLPHGLPARRAAHDRLRRRGQRGVRALPQPALGPAVHPLARRQPRRRRARSRCGSRAPASRERALRAGPLPRRAPRAARAATRWRASSPRTGRGWASRLGGAPGDALATGAAAARELLRELADRTAAHGLHGFPAAQGVGGRLAGAAQRRRGPRARAQPGAARGRARRRPTSSTLLAYLSALADRRGDAMLAAWHRRWEVRLREAEERVMATVVALAEDPERRDPARPRQSTAGRAGHGVANGLGTIGEAIDGSVVGRAARKAAGASERVSRSRTSSSGGGATTSCQPRGVEHEDAVGLAQRDRRPRPCRRSWRAAPRSAASRRSGRAADRPCGRRRGARRGRAAPRTIAASATSSTV